MNSISGVSSTNLDYFQNKADQKYTDEQQQQIKSLDKAFVDDLKAVTTTATQNVQSSNDEDSSSSNSVSSFESPSPYVPTSNS